MESNPITSLLGFWMMLQLFATLALLAGGIYLMFCLGRAASGLDRMANAMEDWVALQNQNLQNPNPQNQNLHAPRAGSTPSASEPVVSAPPLGATSTAATPFTPVTPQEYSQPQANNPDETQRF